MSIQSEPSEASAIGPTSGHHTSNVSVQNEQSNHQPPKDGAIARAATICRLNDAFRQSFAGGQVLLTQGILGLDTLVQATILHGVRSFDRFTTDNDPYGEHDFGSFECGGETVFFKIDYYDLHCLMGSDDPADPSVTTRVLTIMLAAEY
jgi:Protein of unknown function (DUF3768)